MNSYQDFIRGRFQGISLSRYGRLMLAPKMNAVFSSDQPVIWAVAVGAGRDSLRRDRTSRPAVPHRSGWKEHAALDV